MAEIVYLNGEFLPSEEARIPVRDYGFLFGCGLYETMRAYEGVPFRLDRHLERLQRSLDFLKIPLKAQELKDAILTTIGLNGYLNARIRVTVTAGAGTFAPSPASCRQPAVLISVVEYIPYAPEVYQRGFRVTVSDIRRNSQSPLPSMKTTCFLESLLAREKARQDGFDDAVLLNDQGNLAEASSSNLFLVVGDDLVTPAVGGGILPGVTREAILEICSREGIRAIEREVTLCKLISADEVFLTNSMIEIMPVIRVDENTIGRGVPGQITEKLMRLYRELVTAEINSARH
ncbi:MAG: aminotransferase class IV [Dehalococcoidales bacterium]|nr:aminotransferase class IV [Dehalococcoidales bacterium]